jgi:hypothetical protein
MKPRDPVAVSVANIVKAVGAWRDISLRERAAGRRPSVERAEAEARVFAAFEGYVAARRAEKFEEERPTSRMKKT